MAAANDSGLAKIEEITMALPPNTPVSGCHFFKLSAELRNAIYELVVAEDTPIRESRYVEQGLFQTCHQIREESSKMFFRLNAFHFDCHVFMPIMLEITRSCIRQMRTIYIHTGRVATSWREADWANTPVVLCLDVSKGLREMKLELRRDDNDGAGPFELFEIGCRPDCGHIGGKCVIFGRLRLVQQYLDNCAEKARPGTHMTTQIFERVAKMLVGKC